MQIMLHKEMREQIGVKLGNIYGTTLVSITSAVPKLGFGTQWWVVGVISVGRESHSKLKLLHALSKVM